MAIVYTPPGVTVDEILSPSVRTILGDVSQVAVVGEALGYQTGTALANVPTGVAPFTITAPTDSTFKTVDGTHHFISVKNQLDPTKGSAANQSGYAEGGSADFTAALSSDKKTLTVTPVADSDLDTYGGTIKFVFRFVPDSYFTPVRLESQAAIEQRFGVGLTDSGVGSPLSHAATLALENGASSVVCAPLFDESGGVATAPSSVSAASTWASTFAGLRDVEGLNLIVPAVSNGTNTENIIWKAQDHVAYLATQGQYAILLVGGDSSFDPADADASDLRTWASVTADRYSGAITESMIFVSPSRFARNLPNGSGTVTVGGQYVAAAIAGMIAARPISASLTRKAIAGFSSVLDTRDQAGKNADAAAGLLVVEQKGGIIQIRHAITLDIDSTAGREIPVVRAKHHMIESLRATIDTQIIGQVFAGTSSALLVKNAVISVLESLAGNGEIVGYGGVQARVVSNDPTTVEARFSYQPAFPLNYVHIAFSLDLTAGSTTFSDTTA